MLPTWTRSQINGLNRVSFGDSPALADELSDLIITGRKTATCCLAGEGEVTAKGQLVVVQAGDGTSKSVIRIVRRYNMRFCDVGAEFAYMEGEGDRSLSSWRVEHERFFRSTGSFCPEIMLACEEFEIVALIEED